MEHQDAGPGRVGAKRRDQFKSKPTDEGERRRRALAAQQSDARERRLAAMRTIAVDSLLGGEVVDEAKKCVDIESESDSDDELPDTEMQTEGAATGADDFSATVRKKRGKRQRRVGRDLYFARQLQVPDWMTEVPPDLASSWLLMVRPDGDRHLLLSESGHVEVRRKNGHVVERYTDTRLPDGLTILDVVCVKPPRDTGKEPDTGKEHAEMVVADASAMPVEDVAMHGRGRGRGRRGGGAKGRGRGRGQRRHEEHSYAVLDVLFWGDTDVACADAEFRMFWLASRLGEMTDAPAHRARPLQFLPAEPVNLDVLNAAYRNDVGYLKDSLLFLHKEGKYSYSEPVSPLALQWRDRSISPYVVDTNDAKGEAQPEKQAVVLELRGGGHLRTADRIVVASMTEEELGAVPGANPSQGKALLRFHVDHVDFAAKKLSGLEFLSRVPSRIRVWPDSWGRIAFQCTNRGAAAKPLAFDALQAHVGGAVAT